jgi:hypothetical protein
MMKKLAVEGSYLFEEQHIKQGTLLKIISPIARLNDGFVCFVSIKSFSQGDHPYTLLITIHPEIGMVRIPISSTLFPTWFAQTFDAVEVNTDE